MRLRDVVIMVMGGVYFQEMILHLMSQKIMKTQLMCVFWALFFYFCGVPKLEAQQASSAGLGDQNDVI